MVPKTAFLSILLAGAIIAQITNIQISDPASTSPEEVTIAINPADPQVVAAGANINFFYYSLDAGQSWVEKTMHSPYGVWGDPCVIFDPEGNLYFGHLSNPPPDSGYWIDRIVVQKSEDYGISWNDGAGIGYSPPRKNQDKEWLAADITNSQYRNNLYMAWTEFDRYGSSAESDNSRILFSRSRDSGLTWSAPIKVSEVEGDCLDDDNTTEGAVPAIGPEGEVYLSWSGPAGIIFDRSLDGGKTFEGNVFVADQPGGWAFDIEGISRCNGMPVTACDISNSNYRGNIYIMWSDQRNGVGDTDVFLSRSTDQGATWSAPLRVNNDQTQRQQFFSWMTVDPVTGIIYIVFYDRRETAGVATDIYLARSEDGGLSFSNIKISESSFFPNAKTFFGDYINIAAYGGQVLPIWMRMDYDNFYKLSVWTAPMSDSLIVSETVEDELTSESFRLDQNYPNPFNNVTRIPFFLSRAGNVQISIYNSAGKKIMVLTDREFSAGSHQVDFERSGLASGSYYYSLIMDGKEKSKSKKMLLLK